MPARFNSAQVGGKLQKKIKLYMSERREWIKGMKEAETGGNVSEGKRPEAKESVGAA